MQTVCAEAMKPAPPFSAMSVDRKSTPTCVYPHPDLTRDGDAAVNRRKGRERPCLRDRLPEAHQTLCVGRLQDFTLEQMWDLQARPIHKSNTARELSHCRFRDRSPKYLIEHRPLSILLNIRRADKVA